jgi:hypothetical protein
MGTGLAWRGACSRFRAFGITRMNGIPVRPEALGSPVFLRAFSLRGGKLVMRIKTCRDCKLSLPVTGFYRNGTGWSARCRPCQSRHNSDYAKRRYRRDPAFRTASAWASRERYWHQRDKVLAGIAVRKPWRTRKSRGYPKERDVVNRMVRSELAAGRLVRPRCCQLCWGGGRLQAHHEDYAKPLDVIWLCTQCHGLTRRRIRGIRAGSQPISSQVRVSFSSRGGAHGVL